MHPHERVDRITTEPWPLWRIGIVNISRALIDVLVLPGIGPNHAFRKRIGEIPVVAIIAGPALNSDRPDALRRIGKGGRNVAAEIINVQAPGKIQLLGVVHAHDAVRFRLRFRKGGQKEAGEDRDDGDHDQQFDKGETA